MAAVPVKAVKPLPSTSSMYRSSSMVSVCRTSSADVIEGGDRPVG